MRIYVKKLLQSLLALFLVFVIYLNINVNNLTSESHHVNDALPWGEDFNQKQHPPLVVMDKKFHDHISRMGIANDSKLAHDVVVSTPSLNSSFAVYPSVQFDSDDRIQRQLGFVAESIRHHKERGEEVPVKKIMVYSGTASWHIARGSELFKEQKCTVQDCELVDDRTKLNEADVVLFQHSMNVLPGQRPSSQIWALFLLESPYHTPSFLAGRDIFNWTATYRHDSIIVAPYEKYVPINSSLLTRTPSKNFAQGKTKKVAWFVSNCGARNGRRRYAEELSKYIQVDIYGGCGTLKCPRFQSEKCFGMLNTDYKFYLAFENSNCRDYITEKFFINGLKHDVVPIVMGAAPEDYRRAAPPHSFIHVDDFETAKDLAEYLHKLDSNDSLYNEYFAWKGLWDNINTFFWCRVCALAHDVDRRGHSWYEDVEKWWRGPDVCIGQNNWRSIVPPKTLIADLAIHSNPT